MTRASLVAATILLAGAAALTADAAMAQATNKTVTVSFSVSLTARDQTGAERTGTRAVTKTMYISNAGRVFLRNQRREGSFAQDNERGPEVTTGAFTLRGTTITGTLLFTSGAGRMTVNLTPDFQSCSAEVVVARESGRKFTFKGLNGKILTATGPITVSSPSCSVQSGNAFAG